MFALPILEAKWFYRDFTRETADMSRLRCELDLIAFVMKVSSLKPVLSGSSATVGYSTTRRSGWWVNFG